LIPSSRIARISSWAPVTNHDQLGAPMLATSTVFQLYRTLQREGLGGEGNHALVKALERLSGITLGAPAGDLPRSR